MARNVLADGLVPAIFGALKKCLTSRRAFFALARPA
jgi:hypothetical protein